MPHAQVFRELSMNFQNLSHRQCKVMENVFIRADVWSLIYGDMSLECLNHQRANRFIPRSMADNNMLKTLAVVWKEEHITAVWSLTSHGWMKKYIMVGEEEVLSLWWAFDGLQIIVDTAFQFMKHVSRRKVFTGGWLTLYPLWELHLQRPINS